MITIVVIVQNMQLCCIDLFRTVEKESTILIVSQADF